MGPTTAVRKPTPRTEKLGSPFNLAAADNTEGQTLRCSSCNKLQPNKDFHVDRAQAKGYKSRCKACSATATQAWRALNGEAIRAREHKRYHAHKVERLASKRKSNAAHREERKVYARQYRQQHYPEVLARNLKRAHSQAGRASQIVRRAVSTGEITKPRVCSDCGCKALHGRELDGHHDDYSKPLDITWLCKPCHRKRARLDWAEGKEE